MAALQLVIYCVVFGLLVVLFEHGVAAARSAVPAQWTKLKLCRTFWLIVAVWVVATGIGQQFIGLLPMIAVAVSHADLVARDQRPVRLPDLIDNVGPALRRCARRLFDVQ